MNLKLWYQLTLVCWCQKCIIDCGLSSSFHRQYRIFNVSFSLLLIFCDWTTFRYYKYFITIEKLPWWFDTKNEKNSNSSLPMFHLNRLRIKKQRRNYLVLILICIADHATVSSKPDVRPTQPSRKQITERNWKTSLEVKWISSILLRKTLATMQKFVKICTD